MTKKKNNVIKQEETEKVTKTYGTNARMMSMCIPVIIASQCQKVAILEILNNTSLIISVWINF